MRSAMRLSGPINSGAAVGANDEAVVSKDSLNALEGWLIGIYVDYKGTPPATTELLLSTKGIEVPSLTILSITGNTSQWFYPRVPVHLVDGTEIENAYDRIPLHDYINISLDKANAGDNVDIYILME